MKLKLRVTRDDIAEGTQSNGQFCPIALCLKRVVGEDVRSGVNVGQKISISGDALRVVKGNVGAFVKQFDAGKRVKPTEFVIDIPLGFIDPDVLEDRLKSITL